MATPNFDILHLRLSRYLNDAVASAATDGSQFSTAQRSDYLNRASNFLQSTLYNTIGKDKTRGVLQSILKSQSITFSSSGVSVASDYNNMPVSLSKDSSTTLFQYWHRKEELDSNVNPNISSAFTVEVGKIYAYENGAILNAGTGVFKYVGNDSVTEGGSTDISLSQNLWDVVVDLAASFAFGEIGQSQDALNYFNRAFSAIGQMVK